jgi:putative transposase
MPRKARLDAPGVLQHVMARGIERRKIFWDDKDRTSFLERFAVILEETQTQCYAWSLIPNHFHLLLRTGPTPLKKVMGRLMTGYAVTFNKRHNRSGHLFQNRYKSVICEEDPYLLELIRYIHLNPLRAGLVKDLKELDKYPWTGHNTILGRHKNPLLPTIKDPKSGMANQATPNQKERNLYPVKFMTMKSEAHLTGVCQKTSLAEKTIEDVLLYFGKAKKAGRRRYREFVEKGVKQGTREDLQGGGLIRSAGGETAGLLGRKAEEREKGDSRILGSGDFVIEALMKAGKDWEKGKKKKMPLEQLIGEVASHLDLKETSIISASRKREISEARGIICYLAINDLGYSTTEVGRSLFINRENAGRCALRGKNALDKYADIREIAN